MQGTRLLRASLLVWAGLQITQAWYIPDWWRQLTGNRPKCFKNPPIGCFPITYPYNNTGGMAPQSPSSQQISFHFLRDGKEIRTFTHRNAGWVLKNPQYNFNPKSKTVFLVHGWLESGQSAWVKEMADHLHKRDKNLNVLVLDWGYSASNILYTQCVANTRVVGAVLAHVIKDIIKLGSKPEDFHLIGFSLGAHVVGYAGQTLPGLGRITGLDPAAPNFEGEDPLVRLDPTDALVVDVYHTDMEPMIGLGMTNPAGSVDFYINHGQEQPGCEHSIVNRVKALFQQIHAANWRRVVACSHARAYLFFKATINNKCKFPMFKSQSLNHIYSSSEPCSSDDCPTVGYDYDAREHSNEKIFNVITGPTWPYCVEQ